MIKGIADESAVEFCIIINELILAALYDTMYPCQ